MPGGTLAAAIVAKATPDGYTLLATSPAFAARGQGKVAKPRFSYYDGHAGRA